MNQHESDMELAFAHARSKDKICGICMEVVMVSFNSGVWLCQIRFKMTKMCNKITPLAFYCRINLKERHDSESCLIAITVIAFHASGNGDKQNNSNTK